MSNNDRDTSPFEVVRLKQVTDRARPITYGIVQAGPHVDGGVAYIRPADMTDETGVSVSNLMRTDPAIAAAYERAAIRAGDIVLSIGPSYGKVMLVPEALNGANLTQGTARIAPAVDRVDQRFLFWALRSKAVRAQWDAAVGGATFAALNLGPLAETQIPLPELRRQVEIASFLDVETTRIDKLIAGKRRLLDLLEEKRLAVITQAVTRGLDPDVPMRETGVAWLAHVPAHWDVLPLGRLLANGPRNGVSPPVTDADSGTPSLSISAVRNGQLSFAADDVKFVDADDQASKVFDIRAGDLFLVRGNGNPDLVGACAMAEKSMPGSIYPDLLMRMRCNDLAVPAFVNHAFASDVIRPQLRLLARTTVGTFKVNNEQVRTLTLPVPPPVEARSIAKVIAATTAKLARQAATVALAIARLHEYRASLITAAVSGQIDVRTYTGRGFEKTGADGNAVQSRTSGVAAEVAC